MKVLKVYKDGQAYVDGGSLSIVPSGVDPVAEYDVTDMDKDDIEKLRKNPRDKLIKKARKIG